MKNPSPCDWLLVEPSEACGGTVSYVPLERRALADEGSQFTAKTFATRSALTTGRRHIRHSSYDWNVAIGGDATTKKVCVLYGEEESFLVNPINKFSDDPNAGIRASNCKIAHQLISKRRHNSHRNNSHRRSSSLPDTYHLLLLTGTAGLSSPAAAAAPNVEEEEKREEDPPSDAPTCESICPAESRSDDSFRCTTRTRRSRHCGAERSSALFVTYSDCDSRESRTILEEEEKCDEPEPAGDDNIGVTRMAGREWLPMREGIVDEGSTTTTTCSTATFSTSTATTSAQQQEQEDPSSLVLHAEGNSDSSNESTNETQDPSLPNKDQQEKGQEDKANLSALMAESILDEDWSAVEHLCASNPTLAKKQITMVYRGEKSLCLPLHSACKRHPPVSVIDALVTANPSSLLHAESLGGRLPLHIAILAGASLTVVKYLVRTQPLSVQLPDEEGNLPLHCAAMHGTNDVIATLLRVYNDACGVTNHKMKTPLHLICARWFDASPPPPSISLIQSVVEAYPQAALLKDKFGALPIHCAANMYNPRPEVLELLLQSNPHSILLRDGNSDRTPLQLARSCRPQDGERDDHPALSVLRAYKAREARKHKAMVISKGLMTSFSLSTMILHKKKHDEESSMKKRQGSRRRQHNCAALNRVSACCGGISGSYKKKLAVDKHEEHDPQHKQDDKEWVRINRSRSMDPVTRKW